MSHLAHHLAPASAPTTAVTNFIRRFIVQSITRLIRDDEDAHFAGGSARMPRAHAAALLAALRASCFQPSHFATPVRLQSMFCTAVCGAAFSVPRQRSSSAAASTQHPPPVPPGCSVHRLPTSSSLLPDHDRQQHAMRRFGGWRRFNPSRLAGFLSVQLLRMSNGGSINNALRMYA